MKKLCRITALALAMLICLSMFAVSTFAAEPKSTVLSAEVSVAGHKPVPSEKYTVVLESTDEGNPLPAGSEDGKYLLTITDADKNDFPAIEFTKPGIYQYKIYQMVGKAENASYDKTVYRAYAYVLNSETEEDEFIVKVVLHIDGSDEKPDEVVFKNTYRSPEKPDTGDSFNVSPYIFICIICAAAIVSAIVFLKKKRA